MQKRLPPAVVAVVDAVDDVRQALLTPFRPVRELGRLRQRWRLFTGAPRDRYRMWIEARAGAGAPWEIVYRAQDEEHALLADQIAYRRVRAAWNPRGSGGPRGTYDEFVSWIADEVLARDPRLVEVRVGMEKIVIGERGGFVATGERVHVQTRRRRR